MNKNTITGLIIIFAILIGYSIWMTPSDEEKEAARLRNDSIAKVERIRDSIDLLQQVKKHQQDSINQIARQQEAIVSQTSDTIILGSVDRDKMGVFANSSVGTDELYILENEKIRLSISAKGGKISAVRLNEFQTYDSLPLDLFNPEETRFGLTFFASNRIINTDELFFQPVYSKSNQKLSMRLYTDANETSFNKDSYIEFL
jgi:YidC/Oxa1 family membrane protein insertase